jgi:hypothetical protein
MGSLPLWEEILKKQIHIVTVIYQISGCVSGGTGSTIWIIEKSIRPVNFKLPPGEGKNSS